MFRKPQVYYAHCMAIYGTHIETLDIETLRCMGFKVINPNTHEHRHRVGMMRREGKDGSQIMDYFCKVVKKCDGLAFRALPDLSIPAGVYKEILTMLDKRGFILELPEIAKRKVLTIDETRAYIRYHTTHGELKCLDTSKK